MNNVPVSTMTTSARGASMCVFAVFCYCLPVLGQMCAGVDRWAHDRLAYLFVFVHFISLLGALVVDNLDSPTPASAEDPHCSAWPASRITVDKPDKLAFSYFSQVVFFLWGGYLEHNFSRPHGFDRSASGEANPQSQTMKKCNRSPNCDEVQPRWETGASVGGWASPASGAHCRRTGRP